MAQAHIEENALQVLLWDFPFMWMKDIQNIFRSEGGNYNAATSILRRAHEKLMDDQLTHRYNPLQSQMTQFQYRNKTLNLQCLKRSRRCGFTKEQRENVQRIKASLEDVNRPSTSDDLAEGTSQQWEEAGIECTCCFGKVEFESMAQCAEGHLICTTCLVSYAREAAFGSGSSDLSCTVDDCRSQFPTSELHRCLPTDVLEKLEEQSMEADLRMANIDNLCRCPRCNYAIILSPKVKVWKCMKCGMETCRMCQVEWKEHVGLSCEEIETKDETALRKQYEEKMTAAKIRKCHSCRAEFMKEGGCNRMHCRCGATMCYICRQPDIGYSHFCQHPLDPGQGCTKCSACSLFSDPKKDEDRVVAELDKEWKSTRKNIPPLLSRSFNTD